MATVFTVFKETDYDYVILSRGNVFGNTVVRTEPHKGVFKLRKGYTRDGNNAETFGADMPTLHVHPEDFAENDPIVGNGIIVNGVTYDITGMTAGTNFNNGTTEHYTLTLKEASYGNSI